MRVSPSLLMSAAMLALATMTSPTIAGQGWSSPFGIDLMTTGRVEAPQPASVEMPSLACAAKAGLAQGSGQREVPASGCAADTLTYRALTH